VVLESWTLRRGMEDAERRTLPSGWEWISTVDVMKQEHFDSHWEKERSCLDAEKTVESRGAGAVYTTTVRLNGVLSTIEQC